MNMYVKPSSQNPENENILCPPDEWLIKYIIYNHWNIIYMQRNIKFTDKWMVLELIIMNKLP